MAFRSGHTRRSIIAIAQNNTLKASKPKPQKKDAQKKPAKKVVEESKKSEEKVIESIPLVEPETEVFK